MAGSVQEWSSELAVQRQEIKAKGSETGYSLCQEEKVPPSFDSVAASFPKLCLKQSLPAPDAS